MHFNIVEPNSFFSPYIKSYCFMDALSLEKPVTERVIPTEGIQLMIHYGSPFIVENRKCLQPRTILSGLSRSFSDVSTQHDVGVVFIQFKPLGAGFFFDFKLDEIENQSINLCDVYGSDILELEESLYNASGIPAKVICIEAFLKKRFNPVSLSDYHLLNKGMEYIQTLEGKLEVSELSNMLNVSPRMLERKFAYYIGNSPKQYLRIVRFQHVLDSFRESWNPSLTELAYRNGYYDQSHFIHEFKTFTGLSPSAFIDRYPDICAPAPTE